MKKKPKTGILQRFFKIICLAVTLTSAGFLICLQFIVAILLMVLGVLVAFSCLKISKGMLLIVRFICI